MADETKDELRALIRRRIAGIGPDLADLKSRQATESLVSCEEFVRANTVFVFLSMTSEPSTDALIAIAVTQGKRVAVPKTIWNSGEMLVVAFGGDEEELSVGEKGIREPRGSETVPIGDIELAIVPGVAFDDLGNRLGRGGGFYDRFLSSEEFVGVSCGLAYEEQVVDRVPTTDHDQPIDMLITDSRIRRFGARSR
jgi:5-formyltetrahydrofolate cyclo-ligase